MNDVPLLELTEQDYLQMEEALSQTARGRAFLRMRDRRTRVIATDDLHRVTMSLEQQVNRLRGAEPSAVARLPGAGLTEGLALQQELTAITQVVRETRSDIAALRPADTGSNRIEAATGELDEIVAATERATTDILNATEKIQEITQGIPRDDPDTAEMVDAIDAWCIEILTACSFQDITGQRTTKVVNTLRYIEQRVNTMIEIWGVERIATEAAEPVSSHRKMGDTRPDAHLLNGPQLGGPGVSQDDIDALFDGLANQIPHVMERAEPVEHHAPPPPPPPPAPKPAAAKPARPPAPAPEPSPEGAETFSQSDIDALFA